MELLFAEWFLHWDNLYEQETTTLAVSVKQIDYVLLTQADMVICNPLTKYCMLRSA
jgi:hypothetical protein